MLLVSAYKLNMQLTYVIKKFFRIAKGTVATTIMVAVSPTYMLIHSGFRVVSIVLPRKCFICIDDAMWDMYQKLILFFFEHTTGVEIVISGEIPSRKENVVLICNHQCTMDWIVTDMLAVRQNMMGNLRYVFKDGIKYMPLYGYVFGVHGGVFVKRDGSYNASMMKKVLKRYKESMADMYFVVFPEGTRFSLKRKEILAKSQAYAIKNDVKPLTQVLTPRVKAFYSALLSMDSYITAVYDATIVYDQKNEPSKAGHRPLAPNMWKFLVSPSPRIHIRFDRIPIREIPTDSLQSTFAWLHSRFERKDVLISRHFGLPQEIEETKNIAGVVTTYSNPDINNISATEDLKSGKISRISLSRTLPSALVLTTLTAALLSDSRGRKVYLSSLVGGSVLGIIYAKTCF